MNGYWWRKCITISCVCICGVCGSEVATAQNSTPDGFSLRGKVTDDAGEPLIGAAVMEKGTRNIAVTDEEGNYALRVKDAGAVLVMSYVGFETREYPVNGRAVVDVRLPAASTVLDEVVVTGIFNRRKEGFTGSATTVNSEQIRQLTSGNVLKALEVMDPGFKITSSNLTGSNPNAIPDYQLRGSASIGNYELDDASVLRGDYSTRTNQPLFVLDGMIGVAATTIMDLDTEQILSITLLKDAAATVIYGSEAANGVVVVETKKPEEGKLLITYNGKYGVTWPDLGAYSLTSAAEKLEVEKLAGYPYEADETLTSIKNYYNAIERDIMRGVNTDWLALPVQRVFTQRHGINFEGGDKNLRYKIYLGANFAPGVMKETGLTGQSGRVDIHYRLGKFQIINQTYLDYAQGHRESSYGYFQEYAWMNPYYTPYDELGNIRQVIDPQSFYIGSYNTPTYSPLYNTLFDSRNEYADLGVKESIRLEFRPVDELRLELDFTISKNRGETEVFQSAHHNNFAYSTQPENKGSYSYQNSKSGSYRLSLTASYNKLFGEAHLVSLFGRYTLSEQDNYYSILSMTGFPNDKLSEVFMGAKYSYLSGSESLSRALGLVFTGNYAYRQRYVADLNVRMDAASQFGADNRFAPFWSAGVKWNAHNEEFIKRLQLFDELLIRATIGTSGSQDFSSYQALQTYTYQNTMTAYTGSDVVGATLLALGNPNLKWQQTMTQNLALDFTLLEGLLGGRFEVYSKLTRDALLDYTLAPSVGFSTIKENLGEISNRGYEFSLRLMPYKNNARKAYWTLLFTGAYNKSTIEKISDALKVLNDRIYADANTDLSRPLPQYVNGASNTAIWGLQSKGIDPQTGEEVFYTRGNGLTEEWNAKDRVIIGDTNPTLSGSLSTTFAYRDLSITLSGGYTFGGQIYNRTLADKVENANLRLNVDRRVLTDRWKAPGDVALFKKIDGSEDRERTKATSRFVMDNDELRLASINVSYRLGAADYPFLKKIGMSYASLGLYCDDVLRFSTVDMERGINYPFARTVTLSLNMAF